MDTMSLLLLIGCLAGALVLFVLAIQANKQEKQVQERVSQLSKSVQPGNRVLREKELEKSFAQRVLFPLASNFYDKAQQWVPLSSRSWVGQKLIQAGYTQPHYPKTFLGIQMLATLCMFGGLFTLMSLFGKAGFFYNAGLALFLGGAGYVFPMLWLMQQAGKRQKVIQKSLPDFLDLLVICMEAGLGLDIAIHKIKQMRAKNENDFLRDELIRYTADVNFGKPRKQALMDVAERTGVEDLNTIISALVQSYEMGSSVAHTLRVQSDGLRTKRLQKAEEAANKIPVKMVLPIYFFLFPAIFVVIFGPIVAVLVKGITATLSTVDMPFNK